ncbi:unnamed protein product [Rhizoctonia solani]|uniref:Protein kinase domain-containing protein n=1 Tax=Rhizoctonia solani TaxID=456999 RepID=A0A8H3HR30_9AGAM|nr:unnamed protein product [Rhizoctonia solani]
MPGISPPAVYRPHLDTMLMLGRYLHGLYNSRFHPEDFQSRRPLVVHNGHRDVVMSVAFSPDGKSVVSGSHDRTIRIWDAHSASSIYDPLSGHNDAVRSVTYSPLGNLIASGSDDSTIRLWAANTGKQVGGPLRGHDRPIHSVAFSPGANLIASGSSDGTVRLWDVHSRAPVFRPFRGHTSWIFSVAFSFDGTCIAAGSQDKTISVWDVDRQIIVVEPLTGHTDTVRSVSFSPEGPQIISGSYDKTLRLWDAQTGEMIGSPYEGHTGCITSVAFSPNGTYVASGSDDHTVRVWDIRTGRQVDEPFRKHTYPVHSVAYSPCGRHIASGSGDYTVMIWSLSGSISDVDADSYFESEDDTEQLALDKEIERIGQHLSIHDMFDLLSRHGSTDLSSEMDPEQGTAVLVSGGGFGDIWKGQRHDGTRVAIKAWRESVIDKCDYKSLKRATREIHYWSKMKHENVHQLMGLILFKRQSLGMVSEWMDNGNLHEYLRKSPGANRYQLSLDVASGLAYIHSHKMVHGDIKALNVLVSSGGVAKLTDFGLSTMSESSIAFSATTTSQAGSIRWAAPELLLEQSSKSRKSDIYALGMTILEIFTGTIPYPQIRWDFQVMKMVEKGVLPIRPADQLVDDERDNQVWDLIVKCWYGKPSARPSARTVVESLASISTMTG